MRTDHGNRAAAVRTRSRWRPLAGWVALVAVAAGVLGARAALHHKPDTAADRELLSLSREVQTMPPAVPLAPVPSSFGYPAQLVNRAVHQLPPMPAPQPAADVLISGTAWQAAPEHAGAFVPVSGQQLGLQTVALPPLYETAQTDADRYAPVAAGDVNGDGWPDVAVGTARGVRLYINVGGRFLPETVDNPQLVGARITYLALVDLDGDANPDLFVCAWRKDCRILFNRGGGFTSVAERVLPQPDAVAVTAAGFADIGHTGRVDIVTGTVQTVGTMFSPVQDRVTVWHNSGAGRFTPQQLPGPPGEALSVLLSDLNGDGWPDLYVAQDYDEPNLLYLNEHGRFVLQTRRTSPLPVANYTTMSADTADIDGTGRLALYLTADGEGSHGASPGPATAATGPCPATRLEAADLANCQTIAQLQLAITQSTDAACRQFDVGARRACLADRLWVALRNDAGAAAHFPSELRSACAAFPADMPHLRDACAAALRAPLDYGIFDRRDPTMTPQIGNQNLLLQQKPGADSFRDVTGSAGVADGGWAWNGRFADLNNDGSVDLFVTQGYTGHYSTNHAFINDGHGRFTDQSAALHLDDGTPTGGSLALDYDLDGRLDLLTAPYALTPKFFHNELPSAQAVQFQLVDDRHDNRAGVGARVTITTDDGRRQTREIKASGGYDSQDWTVARFGLGQSGTVTRLTVDWPDGSRTDATSLSLNAGRYTVTRPEAGSR